MALALWSRVIEPIALHVPLAPAPKKPIAVVGFNKSGKSLLTDGLIRNEALVRYPTEGNLRLYMPDIYPWHARIRDFPPIWYDPQPTIERVEARYAAGHSAKVRRAVGIFQALVGKTLILDNGNVSFWIDEFLGIFPDARILSLVRDPRDAVAEVTRITERKIKMHPRYAKAGYALPFTELLDRLAARWLDIRRVIARLDQEGRTHIVHFGALTREPAETLKQTFAWLGEVPSTRIPKMRPRPPSNHRSERARIEAFLTSRSNANERAMIAQDMEHGR